jgi:hypothetical protein
MNQFNEELLSLRKDFKGDFKVWTMGKGIYMVYIKVNTS